MKPLAALFVAVLAAPALAVPGGEIGSLRPGAYQCEMPGDATGAAGLRTPDADFDIITANTYARPEGRGTYLLTGDLLQLTSGPLKGAKYHRVSNNFMRQIGPDGQDTAMRCVRRVLYKR
ncbi:MAG: hypothetical protein ABL914_05120 [Novosphingobium sp.]|uniref:hypothetical protein n=1 Tax=Novosphingobium sp. TaxID=1874826 RepID=UPI0032BC59F4